MGGYNIQGHYKREDEEEMEELVPVAIGMRYACDNITIDKKMRNHLEYTDEHIATVVEIKNGNDVKCECNCGGSWWWHGDTINPETHRILEVGEQPPPPCTVEGCLCGRGKK